MTRVETALVVGGLVATATAVAAGVTYLISPKNVKWVGAVGLFASLYCTAKVYQALGEDEQVDRVNQVALRPAPTRVDDYPEYIRWAYESGNGARVNSLREALNNQPSKQEALARAIALSGVSGADAGKLANLRQLFVALKKQGYPLAKELNGQIQDVELDSPRAYLLFCHPGWPTEGFLGWKFFKGPRSDITPEDVKALVADCEGQFENRFVVHNLRVLAYGLGGQREALQALGDEMLRLGIEDDSPCRAVFLEVLRWSWGAGFEYAKDKGQVSDVYDYLALFDFDLGSFVQSYFLEYPEEIEPLLDRIEKDSLEPVRWLKQLAADLPAKLRATCEKRRVALETKGLTPKQHFAFLLREQKWDAAKVVMEGALDEDQVVELCAVYKAEQERLQAQIRAAAEDRDLQATERASQVSMQLLRQVGTPLLEHLGRVKKVV